MSTLREVAKGRLCVFCKHFDITDGEPGYSEWTPGSDMRIGCGKYLWSVENMETGGPEKFRVEIKRAATCGEWQEVKP